jgi:hypothetical protein
MQVTLVYCSSKFMEGEAMKKSSVSEWHKRFKENVEDDVKSCRSRSHRTDENMNGCGI